MTQGTLFAVVWCGTIVLLEAGVCPSVMNSGHSSVSVSSRPVVKMMSKLKLDVIDNVTLMRGREHITYMQITQSSDENSCLWVHD